MKMFAAVFVGLLALANAKPSPFTALDANGQPRLISDVIEAAIGDLSQAMKDAGLDPLIVDQYSYEYTLPVSTLIEVSGYISDLVVVGASNIAVHKVSYSVVTNRLTLDLGLPKVTATCGQARGSAIILGETNKGVASFELAVVHPRIAGRISVNVGIISGISLKDSNLEFTLGGIQFKGDVNVNDNDVSKEVEELLTETIPKEIKLHEKEINELINNLVLDVGNKVLN